MKEAPKPTGCGRWETGHESGVFSSAHPAGRGRRA
jgi:hypothetical protein